MNAWKRALRGGRHDWQLQVLSVFSVGVAFVCLAISLLVVTNVEQLKTRWTHSGRASVFLDASATAEDVRAIAKALEGTAGVTSVEHISSEEARRQLIGGGDDVLSSLPPDAFPASLEVQVFDPHGSGSLKRLAERLEFLPKVEQVQTYEAWGDKLAALLRSAVAAAGVLTLVVLATVITVVGSTIRLSLQHRKVEVEVLQVVGATDSYVRRPFIIEGAAQGALGALGALSIVVVLFLVVTRQLQGPLSTMLGSPLAFIPWYGVAGLVLLGTLLGASSAHLSLRKLMSA